jgi:hypothetical protein
VRILLKVLVLFFLLACFLDMGSYLFRLHEKVQPLPYISGHITRDAYIERHRPEYGCFLYANRNLAAGSRLLGVFLGKRGYYSDHAIRFSPSLVDLFHKGNKAHAVKARLVRMGFTHILIRYDLFNKTADRLLSHSQKKAVLAFFKHHTRILFAKGGYGLYALHQESQDSTNR